MNNFAYQPNAVYTTPYYQQVPCANSRGAGWVAIALVIFLLLIICCCCCNTFNRNGIGL